ncbi:uncharacterized protein LOC110099551 [Dendrobium catenatum]|uniref:Uncharacterized protein n=1 Tax=Dendrobium catenatum TaxID=906689 RepID=A0A2I0VFH2_9ASPA|nr:uncharacterized protein LOC110099551 [Dendrobium catenatum]PKU62167.1 hypothetical protein MA16_Dca020573 [Dendrobium catenatum]
MSCRIHPSDLGAGVCACCLRERLSNLFAAHPDNGAAPSPAIKQKPEPCAAPLLCSRSGPHDSFAADDCHGNRKPCPNKAISNSIVPKPSVSNSWHSALILWQRKKNKKKSTQTSPGAEEFSRGRTKKPHIRPVNARGMSPASIDQTEEEDGRRLSANSSLRRKAQRQQSPCKLSSYALCLNPLMRPSPGNQRNHALETVFTGEPRGTFNPRCSGAGAAVPDACSGLVPNRSRKLVDLGKVW